MTAIIEITITARNRQQLETRRLVQAIVDWWDHDRVASDALDRILGPLSSTMDQETGAVRRDDNRTIIVSIRHTVDIAWPPADWARGELQRRLNYWFDTDPNALAALRRKLGEVTTVNSDVTIERAA